MTAVWGWLAGYLEAVAADTLPPASPPAGWDALVAAADAEGLGAALAFGLRRWPDVTVPAGLAAGLAVRFRAALARHVVMSRDLSALLRSLGDAEIPAIVLKGAYLAETIYPHPALRPMSDIDILVRHGDRLRVDDLLRGLGYRRGTDAHSWSFDLSYDGATFYDALDGARVDVHWRLLNDPRYGWAHAEADAVWDRAIPVTLAGEPALALGPEDLLLSLAVHLAIHHTLAGLRWYWDLSLVLRRWPGLDWATLMARAERWRVRRAVWLVLRRLAALFTVPEAAQAAAARIAPRGPRAIAARSVIARRADRLQSLEHVLPLVLTDRVGDLVRGATSAICPSPGWVRARYGHEAGSLARAYLAHGARMIRVARDTAMLVRPARTSSVDASRVRSRNVPASRRDYD